MLIESDGAQSGGPRGIHGGVRSGLPRLTMLWKTREHELHIHLAMHGLDGVLTQHTQLRPSGSRRIVFGWILIDSRVFSDTLSRLAGTSRWLNARQAYIATTRYEDRQIGITYLIKLKTNTFAMQGGGKEDKVDS